MNRYLVINEGVVVDVLKCDDIFDSSMTNATYDTVQIDNDITHKLNDVFDLSKIVPIIVNNFKLLGKIDYYEIAYDAEQNSVFIGCNYIDNPSMFNMSRATWDSLSDDMIDKLEDGRALVWWKKYKPLVMQLLDVNGIQ